MTLPFPIPKQVLSEHALRPKRSFGQNFLCDHHLVEKIAACCGPPGTVLEIGAGLGGLTVCLLNAGHHVIAVERDRDLIPILDELKAAAAGRLDLLEADAKSLDYAAHFANHPAPHVLSGNLPYNLTGPLMRKAIELAPTLSRAVFLVQLEVAERLSATPGSGNYGALSVFAQAAFDVKREFVVRRGAFYPQPGVDSAVASLTPRAKPIAETREFQQLVSAAFAKRRKTLRNAWKGITDSGMLEQAAATCQIHLDARGETLHVDEFSRMSEEIKRMRSLT